MSAQTLRILIAGALFVHGVGHALAFFMPAKSWLLPGVPESTLRYLGGAIWTLAIVGFLAAMLGFLGWVVPAVWWRPVAVGSAVVSIIGLVLFWGTWPTFNAVGAWLMNAAVLVTQLWLHWPADENALAR